MKRVFKEKEDKLTSELQDAKDQAELLEFRVLELEEEQEKVRLCNCAIKNKRAINHIFFVPITCL